MEALEPRMEEAGGKLRALLRAGLADALRQGNAPAQAHCLQAFAAVGDAHSAEQVRTTCQGPCMYASMGLKLEPIEPSIRVLKSHHRAVVTPGLRKCALGIVHCVPNPSTCNP